MIGMALLTILLILLFTSYFLFFFFIFKKIFVSMIFLDIVIDT